MSTWSNRIHFSVFALLGLCVAPPSMLAGCADDEAVDSGDDDEELTELDEAAIEDNVTVRILSVNSGMALDVKGISHDNGAPVHQWPYLKKANQRWRLHSVGNGDYEIRNVESGKCLDAKDRSREPGARIQQWSCGAEGAIQKWKLRKGSDDTWEIRSSPTGLCLDVLGISKEEGARIQQWGCWGAANQKWRIRKVNGSGNPVGPIDGSSSGSSGSGSSGSGSPFGNGDIHADKLGIYMIPDMDGRWSQGSDSGGCPWPQAKATLSKLHRVLPNAWIRWDNETGHRAGPGNRDPHGNSKENVEKFVRCAKQADVPLIITASAVPGYDNFWARGGRMPDTTLRDVADNGFLREAHDLLSRYDNVKLVETVNEPDMRVFFKNPDNVGDFRAYMSKLNAAMGSDRDKIVGPSTALRENIWDEYTQHHAGKHISYHTYGGWQRIREEGDKEIYITEYGQGDSDNALKKPKGLLSDLWHAERNRKLTKNIKKIFYVDLQNGFSQDTMEGNHFAIRGWVRALAAYQTLASVSTHAYFDDNAKDFIATDNGSGQFGAILWATGTRQVPRVSLGGTGSLNVLRIRDTKTGSAQCSRLADQNAVTVQVSGSTARINVRSLDANGAVLVTTKPCTELAN